mgnify:CR=1 FL=1
MHHLFEQKYLGENYHSKQDFPLQRMFRSFMKLSTLEKVRKVALPVGLGTVIIAGYQGAKVRDAYNRSPKLSPPNGPTAGLDKWVDKCGWRKTNYWIRSRTMTTWCREASRKARSDEPQNQREDRGDRGCQAVQQLQSLRRELRSLRGQGVSFC